MLQTIQLGPSVVDDPQQPVVTPLGTEPPTPLEQPVPKIICIRSDSKAEDDGLKGSGNNRTTEEEEPDEEEAKEETDRPPSPRVEYVPYSPVSAPRRSLVHPTQQNRIYTSRKRVGGGILVPRFL
ncbi:hypothetical protein PIB30_000382 [Stylosanthes scabra]|uniref:Uncharacterized protein n=1 Tax=Stylosanthes scabra TaxID=79078 RepID=A0ABU6U360_9FABA|nr:hypothetical protein [Stylosanthes scabra]